MGIKDVTRLMRSSRAIWAQYSYSELFNFYLELVPKIVETLPMLFDLAKYEADPVQVANNLWALFRAVVAAFLYTVPVTAKQYLSELLK